MWMPSTDSVANKPHIIWFWQFSTQFTNESSVVCVRYVYLCICPPYACMYSSVVPEHMCVFVRFVFFFFLWWYGTTTTNLYFTITCSCLTIGISSSRISVLLLLSFLSNIFHHPYTTFVFIIRLLFLQWWHIFVIV